MKTLALIATFCVASLVNAPKVSAQYAYDPGYDMLAQLNQQQMQLQQQLNQTWEQAIQQYRQESGDWSTPDQVIQQRIMSDYYARNPQVYQSYLRQQNRVRGQIFNNWNESMEMRADSWNQYNDSSDRHQHQMQNYIRGQYDYVNPETGQVWNLPYGQAGYYHFDNTSAPGHGFCHNPYGQYYHRGPNGYWQQMDEVW